MNNFNDIEDFELSNNINGTGISSLYYKYLEFKTALKKVPLKTLQGNGWLNDYEDTKSLGALFSNTLTPNNFLFRKSNTADDILVALWFANVTAKAKRLSVQDRYQFNGLNQEDLQEIAKLSKDTAIIKTLPQILAKKGIVLVYEKPIPGLKVDGLAFLLPCGTPTIALSFRHARVDNFWFTLMHELAHVAIHYELLKTPIIDDFDNEEQKASDIEVQANRLAKNSLVSRAQWRNCSIRCTSAQLVDEFARSVGIHPAIVAGLLRKEMNRYDIYSEIVNQTDTRKLVFDHE
jgi:HTH-type transcriptional regulator/antitoxin HigA